MRRRMRLPRRCIDRWRRHRWHCRRRLRRETPRPHLRPQAEPYARRRRANSCRKTELTLVPIGFGNLARAAGVGVKLRTSYGPRRPNSAHFNGQPWTPAIGGSRSTTVEARSGGQGVASSNLASPTIPQQHESGSDLRKHDKGPSQSTTWEGPSLRALSQGRSQTERRALLRRCRHLLRQLNPRQASDQGSCSGTGQPVSRTPGKRQPTSCPRSLDTRSFTRFRLVA